MSKANAYATQVFRCLVCDAELRGAATVHKPGCSIAELIAGNPTKLDASFGDRVRERIANVVDYDEKARVRRLHNTLGDLVGEFLLERGENALSETIDDLLTWSARRSGRSR